MGSGRCKGVLARLRQDERGVAAVIVAVVLIALFGAAVITVDAGSVWQSRRQAITATDSGALAEAKALAFATGSTSCTGAYQTAIDRNVPKSLQVALRPGDGAACTLVPGTTPYTGYVVVQARKLSQARFSGVFNTGDQNAFSFSAAMWGIPTGLSGVRPIGICKNQEHILEWRRLRGDASAGPPMTQEEFDALPITEPGRDLDPIDGVIDDITFANKDSLGIEHYYWPPNGTGPRPVVHRISFTKDGAEDGACGETDPGNWGWMDFDGGSNGTNDLADWLMNGYQKNFVPIPGCDPPDAPESDGCDGDTGSGGGRAKPGVCPKTPHSPAAALECLVLSEVEFPIVIYDSAVCDAGPSKRDNTGGGGSNCNYKIYEMLGVIVRGFKLDGAESERYIDLQFLTDKVFEGGCCLAEPTRGFDPGYRVMKICAVDHDNAPADVVAARCVPQTTPSPAP